MAIYELSGGGSTGIGLPINISDVNDLANQLAGKAVSNHTHVISDVTDLQTEIDRLDTRIDGSSGGTALPIAISDVTNLQTSLDAKALTTHIHAVTDITGLEQTLINITNISTYTYAVTAVSKTIADRERLVVTTAGVVITLPLNPVNGTECWISVDNVIDIIIARNGQTIAGVAEDRIINRANTTLGLYFHNNDWRVF